MNIVFIGAGAVFGYHSQQFCKAAPKDSKFYVVEPDDMAAKLSRMERVTLKEAARIAHLAIVLTPSYLRWTICEPFVKNGIPVIIEKPLTINWDEILLFADAATHAWICPIVNARCIPRIEHMKAETEKPLLVRSWKVRSLPSSYYAGWHGKYATDGGVLAQQGFHCLDLVCWIGGEPVAVRATGTRQRHNIECEDTASVVVQFANGCRGEVECTTAAAVTGRAGLKIVTAQDAVETEAFQFAAGVSGHTIIARRAFAALAKNEGPPITVESMVPSLRTLHACYVSMDRAGESVKIGERHERLGESSL